MTSDILNVLQLGELIGTGGQPTADQISGLAKEGYEVVINLALPTSTHALPDEGAIVTAQGLTYVHIPVQFEAPTERDFETFRGVMKALAGRKVFVHCALNMRVSAFLYLYRIVEEQLPADNAAAELHKIWEPDEVWRAFIKRVLERQ